MSSTLLYEQALYSDKFRNDVECGKYSDAKLSQMIENNELNEYQMKVVQELAPNIQQTQQPTQQQPVNNSQPQGGYQPKAPTTNTINNQAWGAIVKDIKSTQLFKKLNNLQKAAPNDKYVKDVTTYIIQAFTQLNAHINPSSVRQVNPQNPTL